MASWLGAMLGRLFRAGQELDLLGGINFVNLDLSPDLDANLWDVRVPDTITDGGNRWWVDRAPTITTGGTASASGTLSATTEVTNLRLTTLYFDAFGVEASTGNLVHIEARAKFYRTGATAVILEASEDDYEIVSMWTPAGAAVDVSATVTLDAKVNGVNASLAEFEITNGRGDDIDFSQGITLAREERARP